MIRDDRPRGLEPGEHYGPIDLTPLWKAAALTAVMFFLMWAAHEEGTLHNPRMASDAYAREEQYRHLLEPVVLFGSRALAVVQGHDSIRARELRAAIPADVLTILEEAEDR